jgi:hypothetical protein
MRTHNLIAPAFAWLIAGVLSVEISGACKCPAPPPPIVGTQPSVRIPLLRGKDSAVFVGAVEEVYPKTLSDYERRWRNIYHEELSEANPASVARLRSFVLRIWPRLFSPSEAERISTAKSLDDLEDAVAGFWLFPRRIRLWIEEPFEGLQAGHFVLYSGLGYGDCGVEFKVGEHCLVDAYLDADGRWIAHLCSVTLPVAEASEALVRLHAERR